MKVGQMVKDGACTIREETDQLLALCFQRVSLACIKKDGCNLVPLILPANGILPFKGAADLPDRDQISRASANKLAEDTQPFPLLIAVNRLLDGCPISRKHLYNHISSLT